MQQPKLILVLGKMPATFLAGVADKLHTWKNRSIKEIDMAGCQITEDVSFANGINTSLLLLTHPSYRSVNRKHRLYNNLPGADVEVQMLLDVVRKYGLQKAD